jgi:hypothetical protein
MAGQSFNNEDEKLYLRWSVNTAWATLLQVRDMAVGERFVLLDMQYLLRFVHRRCKKLVQCKVYMVFAGGMAIIGYFGNVGRFAAVAIL